MENVRDILQVNGWNNPTPVLGAVTFGHLQSALGMLPMPFLNPVMEQARLLARMEAEIQRLLERVSRLEKCVSSLASESAIAAETARINRHLEHVTQAVLGKTDFSRTSLVQRPSGRKRKSRVQ